MGTGKSTVGKILARETGRRFFDTDRLIEGKEGRTIAEIFSAAGEAAFRDIESAVIAELGQVARAVISTGGGALLRDENVRALSANGFLVCLRSSPESILRRTARAGNRPLLSGGSSDRLEQIKTLLAERRDRYRLAHLTIDVSGKPSTRAAEEILSRVDFERAG
jgi:shikimate kinase